MKIVDLAIAVLLCALVGAQGTAEAQAETPHPVVVELFTSQGCSSCPPADRYLGDLRQRDDVIALAFHIDYWDHIGWRDPFSLAISTERQRSYVTSMNLWSLYTPQMVIDGRLEGNGSDTRVMGRQIARIAALAQAERGSIPIRLRRDSTDLLVSVGAGPTPYDQDIWLVSARDSHTTEIARGENAGKTLTDYNIVRDSRRLGHWNGRVTELRIPLASLPDDADFVAVLLQETRQGPIHGAARLRLR